MSKQVQVRVTMFGGVTELKINQKGDERVHTIMDVRNNGNQDTTERGVN